MNKRCRNYRNNNLDSAKSSKKKWDDDNRKLLSDYRNNKREEDPLFKLMCNIRSNISHSYKRKRWSKKSRTQEILGCDFKVFEQHLNGFVYGESGLDLDHIIPVASAKAEEELLSLNHYTNFQLLPSAYNQYVKRDKDWDREDFENWLSLNSINPTGIT